MFQTVQVLDVNCFENSMILNNTIWKRLRHKEFAYFQEKIGFSVFFSPISASHARQGLKVEDFSFWDGGGENHLVRKLSKSPIFLLFFLPLKIIFLCEWYKDLPLNKPRLCCHFLFMCHSKLCNIRTIHQIIWR